MSRKTTKYARKCKVRQAPSAGAWMDSILLCRPYSDDVIPGSWLPGTQGTADKSIKLVRDAFAALKSGQTAPGNEEDFDLIAHALGVSCIRAGQIAGVEADGNIMLPPLIAGNVTLRAVLARRRKWLKWELLTQEVEVLDWAIEIYETILQASSPAQMVCAVDLRMQALKGQTLESIA